MDLYDALDTQLFLWDILSDKQREELEDYNSACECFNERSAERFNESIMEFGDTSFATSSQAPAKPDWYDAKCEELEERNRPLNNFSKEWTEDDCPF